METNKQKSKNQIKGHRWQKLLYKMFNHFGLQRLSVKNGLNIVLVLTVLRLERCTGAHGHIFTRSHRTSQRREEKTMFRGGDE